MVSRAKLYRQKVAECAEKALQSTDPEAKHLYLQLAERWRQLANEVELFRPLKP
jgi:hypothetical protein